MACVVGVSDCECVCEDVKCVCEVACVRVSRRCELREKEREC